MGKEIIQFQLGATQQEIICNQQPRDRPKQGRIAHQPGENIRPGIFDEFPWEYGNANGGGDVAAHLIRDFAGRQIGKPIGRGHHIGGEICGQGRDDQSGERKDNADAAHTPGQINRVPDRFAINLYRGRGYGNRDKGKEGHRDGQAKGLSDHLVFLGFGKTGKVWNV